MISLIIPSFDNLKHLKNVYNSIQKHAPKCELILLDDGSTDGTWEWMQDKNCIKYRSETRVGHTILYDKGIELATNDIVGILHADMIIGPNYIENLLKHIKPGTVVCATRVEPPLHPEGKEKIIRDFGQDFDTLDVDGFESFCIEQQNVDKDKTSSGMFAPWIICKDDFNKVGGHDPLFAPFPYEDSDIFQRWILAGYTLIQSRDSLVYHLTCRGHRWNETIGTDDEFYKRAAYKSSRNYLRKWGSWVQNDEYQHPIITSKHDIGAKIHNINYQLIEILEPWFSCIYVDEHYTSTGLFRWIDYVEHEQDNTTYNMRDRVKDMKDNTEDALKHDVFVEFDASHLTNESLSIIQNLNAILQQNDQIGEFELDIFKVTVREIDTHEMDLVVCKK